MVLGCYRVSVLWLDACTTNTNAGNSGGAIAGWVSQYIGRRLTIMYVSPTCTGYGSR